MPLLNIGDKVPDFKGNSQLGAINFHHYIENSWCLFFAHPSDFTPICTTEFGIVSKKYDEFKQRNCKVVGLSIDSVEEHKLWIEDINETQETTVSFPVVADESGIISSQFSFSEFRDGLTIIKTRVLYLISPEKKVSLAIQYPGNVGRNFEEILRALDALQISELKPVGTPAEWKPGDDVIILPEVTDEVAEKEFKNGFTKLKPYLRLTSSTF